MYCINGFVTNIYQFKKGESKVMESKVKITIKMLEGNPSNDLGELVCDSFEEANIRLEGLSIRHNAPIKGEGYLKTDLIVEVEGLSWQFRYDMKKGGAESHESIAYPDLKSNFINRIKFYAGLKRPSHMTEKQYHETPLTYEYDGFKWKRDQLTIINDIVDLKVMQKECELPTT